jgi:hypothetical protein
MADEQVIVTRFVADLTDFEQGVQTYEQSMTGVETANKKADSTGKQLAATTGDLGTKYKLTAAEATKAAEASAEVGVKTQQSAGIIRRAGETVRQFALGARDGFRTAVKEVGGLSGIVQQVGAKIKGFGAAGSAAFKQLGAQVTNVAGQVPLIGGFAAALGPVGIAAAAAAGGLLSIVKNTDAGATALEGLGVTGGAIFDRITGLAKSFFDTFTNSDTVIGKIAGALGEVAGVLFNIVTGPLQLLGEFTGITDALKSDLEFGQQIANQLDELADKQLGVNEATAKNEITIRKNLAALRDTTKTTEERLKIADEITAKEEENLAIKRTQLTQELAILKAQAARQQALKGEVDDALKAQISGIQTSIFNLEAESVSLTERVAARRAGIVEAEEQRKEAARQKALEAQRKREAEALKLAEQRAAAEQSLDNVLDGIANERLARQQSEDEREVQAIKDKYAKFEQATLEGIEKLRAAAPPNQQSEITRREAEAILLVETAKNEELAALEAKRAAEIEQTRAEALEKIRTSLLTSTEREREAVQAKYDELFALAEQNITDEDELERRRLELARAREAELTGIVTDEERKRTEAQAAELERRAALQEQNAQLLTDFAVNATGIIAQAAAAGEDISEKASKAIVALLLDTLEKIILANAFQVQAISAGAPDPANVASGGIFGIARGIILAGLVKALFGAAKAAITANYLGDPFVGGDGTSPTWSGRDGYLRRLDKGERVVTSKDNAAYWDDLEAMRKGKWDDHVLDRYIAPAIAALNWEDDRRAADFVASDFGSRVAGSVQLMKYHDANIVDGLRRNARIEREQTVILSQIAKALRPTSKRYY